MLFSCLQPTMQVFSLRVHIVMKQYMLDVDYIRKMAVSTTVNFILRECSEVQTNVQ